MFDISIVFLYVDSDFPLNSLSLLFTFPLPSYIGFLKNWLEMFVDYKKRNRELANILTNKAVF